MQKMNAPEEKFMRRALELAAQALGQVSPNPMVGCVLVHEGKIIGEGFHRQFGEAHAEVNALDLAEDKDLLPETDVYVTLEPCSHFGKTPPCANLLVISEVRRVIVACPDPNPLVAGRGLEKLRAAGIPIVEDFLRPEAEEMNRRFLTFMRKKRPYFILKYAQTNDGFIARPDGDSKWISNKYSRLLTHKWRSEEDAIMVGTETALKDNPQLNVRDLAGRNPVRIVIDRHLRLPENLQLFDGSQTTICYTLQAVPDRPGAEFVCLNKDNFWPELAADLFRRGIQSVLAEGGSTLHRELIKHGMCDEMRIFRSPKTFGAGIAAVTPVGKLISSEKIHDDELLFFRNAQS